MKTKPLRMKSQLSIKRLTASRCHSKLSQLGWHLRNAPTRLMSMVLSLVILTGGMWMSQTVLWPQVTHAYTSRVDVRLDRLRDETYQSLIRRAEMVARAAAQRSFDRDILVSEVSVMVIGESQGSEAPLLLLDVSRQNWRDRPDTRRWAIYYRSAKPLLHLSPVAESGVPNAAAEK